MLSRLPILGVGLGFREPFQSDVFLHRQRVDFLEIVADHYLDAPPEKERELDLLASHFTLIPHAINLSLGSAEGVDPVYVRKLTALIRRLDPPWWSEHIAFTRAGGADIGHLSPLPFTREGIETLCRNIAEVRRTIQTSLILENITYTVVFPFSEMDEVGFLKEVLERSDCGLLLDVTNLYTNSVNHGHDPIAFLQQLPLERVVQLHFVGGHWHEDVLVDSHSQRTPPEVWALMEEVMKRAAVKGVVLERDENLPPFEEMLEELEQVRRMGRSHGQWG